MIKIAKHLRMLYTIICLILCIGVLTGCQSKKYEMIELPESGTEVSIQEEETTAAVREQADELQSETASAPETDSLPEGADADAEVSRALSGSKERGLSMSDGFVDVDDTVTVTSDLVNVRRECDAGAEIVTQLNAGDTLRRTGYSDGWTRVIYGDTVCYVSSEYVSAGDEPAAAEADAGGAAAAAAGEEPEQAAASNGIIVAIDPGHQAKANTEKEPIGPGASTMKAKVEDGATGVSTGLKECELTLAVSQKVQAELEARGYQVVMIRESNDVNISSAERAQMANESGASVFVRIHGNSLDNSSVTGVLSMCQTSGNPYNGELHNSSYALSKLVTDSICAATGARNRGVQETDAISDINWCEIPVSVVEMGFLSNPEEDKNLADEAYQDKLAQGIANGIDAYFGR